MAARLGQPIFTENFANNLDEIRLFLEPEGTNAFKRLCTRIFDDIVPTLCQFPQSVRRFLTHPVRSLEAQTLARRLERLLKKRDELREFVVEDYLILYVVRGKKMIFLAIKHHRQLSFDFRHFWF
ncbi:MAG: type II toxin-antitoxin system RelE/ParE family toxin [Acidobacteria bacterium]|nr:type II toxin-antitoxin system RelE/ParE family toxin [Acidobacteriota bacterium]